MICHRRDGWEKERAGYQFEKMRGLEMLFEEVRYIHTILDFRNLESKYHAIVFPAICSGSKRQSSFMLLVDR